MVTAEEVVAAAVEVVAAPIVAPMETGEAMVIEEEALTVATEEETVMETLTEAAIEAHTEVVVADTTIVEEVMVAEEAAMEIAVAEVVVAAAAKAVMATAIAVEEIEAIPILVVGQEEIRIVSHRPKNSVSRTQVRNRKNFPFNFQSAFSPSLLPFCRGSCRSSQTAATSALGRRPSGRNSSYKPDGKYFWRSTP